MVKRMPFLLLFYGPFLFLFALQIQIVSTKTVINNLQFRINSAGQFELGPNSTQCLSVKADFSNKFRLKKPAKGQVQILSETCAYTSSQLFRQVYIDNSPATEFGICLQKYHTVYAKNDSILNNFYCLFVNNKGLLKLSPRLKKYADVVSKTELHWSLKNVQDDSFSEFFNTKKKNYLYTTKNDKIRAFSEASDQMIEFRKLLSARNRVSISGPCNTNPCQNNAECKNDPSNNSFVCNCPDGFDGDLCENDINDCKENPCANSGMCIDRINSFVCKCADNWGGHLCETKVLTRQLVLSNPRFPNGTFRWDRAPGNLIDGKWLTERGYENFAETHEGRILYVDLPSTIINVTDIIVYPKQEQGFWRYESMVVSIDDDENPCVTYQKLDAKSVQATKETGIIFHCYGKSGTKIVLDMSQEYKLHLSEIIAYGYDLNDPCNDHICNSDTSSDCIVDEDGMPYCDCLPGWEGIQCEINIDDCLGHDLCQNDSLCQDEVNGYTCLCPAGFEGKNCEINVDDCLSNNCQNGSICMDDIDSYVCQCDVGWEGQFCESNIDDCTGDPCQNSGICADGINSFTCICQPGWEGEFCEIDTDDCESNSCENGSECVDGLNSYTCTCPDGWIGQYCEISTSQLRSDTCQENSPCKNGSLRPNTSGSLVCNCLPGFTGLYCDLNININQNNNTMSTMPNICPNGVPRINEIGEAICQCHAGWTGKFCQENIDECLKHDNPCLNNSQCYDMIDDFYCLCPSGYGGKQCELDINECADDPCQNGACIDGLDRFECRCEAGWEGELCEIDTDDCLKNQCQNNAICIDQLDNYICQCPTGYFGPLCSFTDYDQFNNKDFKSLNNTEPTPQIGPYGPSQIVGGPCRANEALLNGQCRPIPSSGLTRCGVVLPRNNDLDIYKDDTDLYNLCTKQNFECPYFLRIIGGTKTANNRWPWMVSIKDGESKTHFCGGSIVHSRFILTAAHCFKMYNNIQKQTFEIHTNVEKLNDESRTVFSGSDAFFENNRAEFSNYIFQSKEVRFHPNYDHQSFDFDAALILLQHHIPFNHPNFYQKVLPICLETTDMINGQLYNLKNETEDYRHFWATGYGKFSNSNSDGNSNDLMQIKLPFVKNDVCKGIYDRYSNYEITENMICAGPQG